MSGSPALDNYLQKWRRRWPEWQLAELFVPQGQRELAVTWFALLQEFDDAFNISGDPLPADAKLRWWREELHAWEGQRSRHPLGRRLGEITAAWSGLAQSLEDLPHTRDRDHDIDAARVGLQRYARAIAAIEAVLFPDTESRNDIAEGIVMQTLAVRCMSLVAPMTSVDSSNGSGSEEDRMSSVSMQKDRAGKLLRHWSEHAGTLPRRIRSVLVWQRLGRFAAGERRYAHGSLSMLWRIWNMARRRDQ
ncbi:MAG: phytoene/squalene synthase family protein [Xanthomonadaceae bacterium]|jgi:hypothetical protein|nr:phytoene/squalene synthase family protein [Xanthomonadaceae bacterium]